MVPVTTAGFAWGWTGSRVGIGSSHGRTRGGTPLRSPILGEGATVDPGGDGQNLVGGERWAGGLPLPEGPGNGPAPGSGGQQLAEEIATRRVKRRNQGQRAHLPRGDVDQ